jgi:hypothetical protein
MDIFEITPEQEAIRLENLKAQREAENRVKAQAEWAKLVEAANRAPATQCCEKVYGSGRYSSFHGSLCAHVAKFHREEHVTWDKDSPMVTRHYCGVHDPVSRHEREQKKHAEETRQRQMEYAREDRIRARQNLISRVVGHLTNEQLVELESFLQTTQFAKLSTDGVKKS